LLFLLTRLLCRENQTIFARRAHEKTNNAEKGQKTRPALSGRNRKTRRSLCGKKEKAGYESRPGIAYSRQAA